MNRFIRRLIKLEPPDAERPLRGRRAAWLAQSIEECFGFL